MARLARAEVFAADEVAIVHVMKNIKGVSDGLEFCQFQIRRKIFEFDFCLFRRCRGTGVLDFLRHGFQCSMNWFEVLQQVGTSMSVGAVGETEYSSAGTQLCEG